MHPAFSPPTDPAQRALMPNLFVIGASKSGSSALHAYLSLHPDIRMSREKEPCFFVDRDELSAAWPIRAREAHSHEWSAYLDLWAGGEEATYRAEGSVYYSQAPHFSGVAARIAAACPEARIVYLVREPVDRAMAHYWQRFKEFQEKRLPEDAMTGVSIYRDTSDYARQLDEYLAVFPRENIKIVVAERLRARRRETLADLLDWLGLPAFDPPDEALRPRHSSPPTSRRERVPGVKALRDSAVWARLRRILPEGAVSWARSMATTRFDKSEVDDSAARAVLRRDLTAESRRFQEIAGEKLPEWEPDQPSVG